MKVQHCNLGSMIAAPLSNYLNNFYNQYGDTIPGKVLSRVGYLVNGVIEPLSSTLDGVASIISTIFGAFTKVVGSERMGNTFFKAAHFQVESFSRILSNTYVMLLKIINPEAKICDNYLEEGENVRDDGGIFSQGFKAVFSGQIKCCYLSQNILIRQVLSRILAIVGTGVMISMRCIDLGIGIGIAALSIVACGTQTSANNYAYKSLKIGAFLGDIMRLFRDLIDPSQSDQSTVFGEFKPNIRTVPTVLVECL